MTQRASRSMSPSMAQYTRAGERWQQDYQTANVTCSHVYLGRLMEKVTSGGTVDWKHYIFAEGRAVALYSRKSTGTNTLSYLLRDHQGSVDVITSSAGAVVVRESFDAYGARRGPAWSGAPSSGDLATINGLTRRGYTGHEMLDSTGLIHMNGRVYDPLVARFVSADPYFDGALGGQGWNRFGYVGGNPLTFTDPSGFTSQGSEQPHVAWQNGDQHPSANVEIVKVNGLDTVMAYGRRESSISLDLVQLMEVPHPGGGGGGDGGVGGGLVDTLDEVVVSAPRPRPPVPPNPSLQVFAMQQADSVLQFLCDAGAATAAQGIVDAVDNAGTAADFSAPAVGLGASAAGLSRGAYSPQALSFLGTEAASALSLAGRIGTVASGIGIAADLVNGQWADAFYGAMDFGVYWGLALVGAGGAITTGGHTLAASATAALAYTLNGGSQGMVQSSLCHP